MANGASRRNLFDAGNRPICDEYAADIEVIDSPELIDYLKKQVRTALNKWGATDESDS